MGQNIKHKIQQLIDNQLPGKEKNELIAKIKASKELKMEFTILASLNKNAQNRLKENLKKRIWSFYRKKKLWN